MSVDLSKHKADLMKAWEEIHDPKGKNNWVMYGYDGQYTNLKVVSQGEDGIEEMVDDLNGGKILYAGLRVIDPNTNLPKIVFINWQGEGVPATVKGKCANHLQDITALFKGVHVQINARSDDDVDEDAIIEKVKNSSGANYGFHKEKPMGFIPQGDIGTNYEKQKPHLDINLKKKDTFWAQSEKEEKSRKDEETKRKNEERIAESRQRAEREKREAAARDEFIQSRERRVSEQRDNQKKQEEQRKDDEIKRYRETMEESHKDDEEFRKRSDSERRKRLQEANQLIQKRQDTFGDSSPRDIFQKESSVGSPTVIVPKKKVVPLPPTINPSTPKPLSEPVPKSLPEPVSKSLPVTSNPEMPETIEPKDELYENVEDMKQTEQQTSDDQQICQVTQLSARALYDYQAADKSEITFDPDDIITNIEMIDEGWWRGMNPNGGYGMFPSNYVEVINCSAEPVQVQNADSTDGACAKAIYDYQAADDSEISFDPDDIIRNIEKVDEGWWRGDDPNGKNGLFPANYVELL